MGIGFTSEPGGFGKGEDNEADMAAMLRQMGRVFSHLGQGPVPASLVREVAGEGVQSDPSVSGVDHAAVDEACRLADLWLTDATIFPATTASARGWSRAQWLDHSTPIWMEIVTPLAASLSKQMGAAMEEMTGQFPAELPIGQMKSVLEQIGGAMLATQLGQALGSLASTVLTSTDLGIPMASSGEKVLLPANVREWGEDLGVAPDQVRLFLALRESAASRLFAETPWLKAHVINAIHAYAAGIKIDLEAMQEQAQRAMEQMQGGDPEDLQATLELFSVEESEEQRAALARLETILALVEGWIDHVTTRAAGERLPSFGALSEMARRRRAAGGPAEAIFGTVIGLTIRPRRIRDASNLWAAVEHARGVTGRDALWAHPEALPSSSDLDDPLGFVEGLFNS